VPISSCRRAAGVSGRKKNVLIKNELVCSGLDWNGVVGVQERRGVDGETMFVRVLGRK